MSNTIDLPYTTEMPKVSPELMKKRAILLQVMSGYITCCGSCIHRCDEAIKLADGIVHKCDKGNGIHDDDWFCADGERR